MGGLPPWGKGSKRKTNKTGIEILRKVTFAKEPTWIDLVLLTDADLALDNRQYYGLDDIYPRGIKLGLELCPNEVGLALREDYEDQPVLEELVIAMTPITLESLVFFLSKQDGHLCLMGGYPNSPKPRRKFVFMRPRK